MKGFSLVTGKKRRAFVAFVATGLLVPTIACTSGSVVEKNPVKLSISGAVSGSVVAGVKMTLTGASSASATTDAGGTYSFAGLGNGAYTITPSLAGYEFNPQSAAVTLR